MPADKPGEVPSQAAWLYALQSYVTWEQAIGQPCVVVLGEAGCGKTEELRGQASRLAGQGKAAFFLRVEELALDGPWLAIDDNREAFERWKDRTDEGWFFLDSVDEAKLHQQTLSRAVAKLEAEIRTALRRCHIIVSCRHSDWRDEDKETLERLAPRLIAPPASDLSEKDVERATRRARLPDGSIKILQLAPLNREQIQTYAVQKAGLVDADAFMWALGRADLWGLAGRPLDVDWLAAYWKKHQRLGSLREMIESNIVDKLKERHEPARFPAALPLKQAREAVERIALVMTMTGVDSVALLGADAYTAAGALDARGLLSEQDDNAISGLLRLPVFDPATLGRVRFHHRSVREYLSASCLRRLGQGRVTQRVHDLVFATVAGRSFARPGFEAIAAWLALDDAGIREYATKVAPEHLMDQGDPSGLPIDTRRDVLRAYVARFEGRTRTMHHFDGAGLERFACDDLIDDLREILFSTQIQELREAILEMIERKKLRALVDAALAVAQEPALSGTVGYRAIRAVAKVGTAQQKTILAEKLIPKFAGDRQTATTLLDHLLPGVLTVEQVLSILEQAQAKEYHADGYSVTLDHLHETCPPSMRADLLMGLIRLSERLLAEKRPIEWDHVVVPLLDEALRDGKADSATLSACMPLLEKAREDDRSLGRNEYAGKLALRRAMFWRSVAQNRSKDKRSRVSANGAWPYYWFEPATEDAKWLEEDARCRGTIVERLIAFDGLLLLSGWGKVSLDEVQRLAAQHKELGQRLSRYTRARMSLAPDFGARHHELRARSWEARRRRTEEQEREELLRVLPEVRRGVAVDALWHLYWTGLADYGVGAWSVDPVREKYGPEIAQAMLEGLRLFWDLHAPPNPLDFKPNELPGVGALGFLSVDLDVDRGLDMGRLDEMNLRKVVGYSIWNARGFPPWLDRCARRAPDVVREVLAPALRRELGLEHVRNLSNVASASELVRTVMAPVVLDLIAEAEPSGERYLQECLRALRGLESERPRVIALCRERSLSSTGSPKLFGLWWTTWCALDPTRAVEGIRDEVSRNVPLDVGDACVLAALTARPWGADGIPEDSWGWLPGHLSARTADLSVMLDVVLKHVRFGDDEEGFRSPRRGAQEVRWRLIGALTEPGTSEAIGVLDGLAARYQGERFWPDWFKRSADECAVRAARSTWSLQEAIAFLDTQPATHPSVTTMPLPTSTILHLSDLHFGELSDASRWSSQLAQDLRDQGIVTLDAVILSGDITDRSSPDQYDAARAFLDKLREEYPVEARRIIVVPGNHDLSYRLAKRAYPLRYREELPDPPQEGTFIPHGTDAVGLRDDALYAKRFEPFSTFYQGLHGEPYPLDHADQGLLYHLPDQGILVLGLNSAWQIDHHYTDRASIDMDALSLSLTRIRRTPEYDGAPLKIAVWHHPIQSPFADRIKDTSFLQQLAKAGFRLALHGHIHRADVSLFQYDRIADGRRIDIIGAGTFGAPTRQWTPGYPLQYNLLRIEGRTLTVHTRRREEPNGAWAPDARWTQGPGKDPLPRYTVERLAP